MEKIQIMRNLAEWFEDYGWTVYYNQKNPDGYPTFHANTNSRGDMLLQKNNYFIMVEVKSGEDHKNILNGIDQILKYAGEYYSGRAHYHLNGTKIPIQGVFFATEFSDAGYLYRNESQINYLDYEYLSEEYNMVEKPITHSLTRFLWRQWEKGFAFLHFKDLRKGRARNGLNLPENKPRVGTIVSKTYFDTRQTGNQPWLYANSNHFVPMGCKEIYCFEEVDS